MKIRFDGVRQLQMIGKSCSVGMTTSSGWGPTRGGNVYQAQKATTVR